MFQPLIACCILTLTTPGLGTDTAPRISVSRLQPQGSFASTGTIHRGSPTKQLVALTFDACPSTVKGGYDEAIVQILLKTKTPATFFLGGRWAAKHPRQTRFLSQQRLFAIGTHGNAHIHLSHLTDSAIGADLRRSKEVLQRLTGRPVNLFRPPYAEDDQRTVHIADSLGLLTVLCDLASGDPDTAATAQKLVDYVSAKARNGSIIVMHVNGRGWHTSEALPEILSRLRKRGFAFVTVPTLLDLNSPDARGAPGGH
jgi:peptidoglycan/xylan/chitin deacetylase (PgdA/CDA1 family)